MENKLTVKMVDETAKALSPNEALEFVCALQDKSQLHLQKLIIKYEKKLMDYNKELERLNGMMAYEKYAYDKGYSMIAGIDEAGRGPLAGPVVAAAVILPDETPILGLNDSKKLSPALRDRLFDEIREKAIAYSIGIVDEKCIDSTNIKKATHKAMKEALTQLPIKPDLLLIDAETLSGIDIPQQGIIKGDALSVSIAAASVLAKVTRDRLVDEYDARYPEYGFKNHKGYGTSEHINAIKKFGLCPIHRISFTKNFV